jgi:protein O-GlcNAc transferase
MTLAVQRHQAGNLADAERLYRQVLAQQPNFPNALHLLGLVLFQGGHAQAGLEMIDRAVTANPSAPDYHLNRGVVLDQMGRSPEAIESFQRVLALRPNLPEAHANLGNALRKVGRLEEAESACRRALELRENYFEAHLNLGNALQEKGDYDQAIARFSEVIRLRPGFAEGHYNLGNALMKKGRFEDAAAAYRQALQLKQDWSDAASGLGAALRDRSSALGKPELLDESIAILRQAMEKNPDSAPILTNLGHALMLKGELEQAIALLRRAIQLRPDLAPAQWALGMALHGADDAEAALIPLRQAVVLQPDFALAYQSLGKALGSLGQVEPAIAALRRALTLKPDLVEAMSHLGHNLSDIGEVDEAIGILRQAVVLAPADPGIQNNLGVALKRIGQLQAADACYELAASLESGVPVAATNRIYACWFDPRYDHAAILKEERLFEQRYSVERMETPVFDRSPDRRLKIGYVSPDFRDHVVGQNLLPLLREHDHRQFEIFCYSNQRRPDKITDRFRSYADQWRDIAKLSDQAVAHMIRADRIDVLVDLTLHMAHGRLLVFARKPAPVQATFAGYPGGTGLFAMDWRVTDPYLDPPGEFDGDYSEKSHRLTDSFWCYDPDAMESSDLEVGPLPATQNGFVTFGCLNNFCKVNNGVLELWSRVLHGVPRSRLILLAPAGQARQWTLEKLAALGVEGSRVDFVKHQPRQGYLAEFRRIDLCLDTLPYNGHTTSLDSMWMGVPVVTRVGRTVVGRAGWSQLSNLKLTELAAWDDDAFVKIATEWAGDVPRLAELRRTLRQRMLDSPLTDAKRFARTVENAWRQMWRSACHAA